MVIALHDSAALLRLSDGFGTFEVVMLRSGALYDVNVYQWRMTSAFLHVLSLR